MGILVDVSESMKNSVGGRVEGVADGVEADSGSWARSIFKVVDELIKHDVPSSNQAFALAFGSPFHHSQVFDLLSSLGKANEEQSAIEDLKLRKRRAQIEKKSLKEIINEALDILEKKGAKRIRYWGKMKVLLEVLDDTTATAILYYLQRSPDFTRKFVYDCLPPECRQIVITPANLSTEVAYGLSSNQRQEYASKESVREVIEKAKQLLAESRMVAVNKTAIMSVQSASEILHTSKGDQEVTKERVDELLKTVEPYIYGGTPLIQAMHFSVDLFSRREFKNHKKLLFILSDGQPNDRGNPPPPLQELSNLEVNIASCFISDHRLSDPRHLYSKADESWEPPAKFMFEISSVVKTQEIPRTLFVKKKWKIDIDNNETRLFFQVNHPDVIKEVCDMAKKAVFSQDALSDVLTSVDLDIYINNANKGLSAGDQGEEEICYAIASAVVMHLAMKRIIGRDGGYPDFFELRDKLIAEYGTDGARTKDVLKKVCPEYRLRCKEVNAFGAMKAISANRPVVATFYLTEAQWDQFDRFFDEGKNKREILTKSDLNSKHQSSGERSGHAVVLTSYDAQSLRLMNSWGVDFADDGFFRVQNADVLGLKFLDVDWDENDLSEQEKKANNEHGADVARRLMKSLKGLQVVKYKCPLCAVESKVVDYSGHLLKAKCPACKETFNASKEGGDLALNLYLTSLMR